MGTQNPDVAGVVAIPPLIYLAFLGLGTLLEILVPTDVLPIAVQLPLGILLILTAAVPVTLAVRAFRNAGTPLDVRKPVTALVTTGVFRFSRNPAYLALTLLYAGIAILADSVWMLGLLLPVLWIMHAGVIVREERYLERRFGESYLHYKRAVRRWL